jgi:hypothetical protein
LKRKKFKRHGGSFLKWLSIHVGFSIHVDHKEKVNGLFFFPCMVFHSPLEKKIIVKAWREGSLFKWLYVGLVFSILLNHRRKKK